MNEFRYYSNSLKDVVYNAEVIAGKLKIKKDNKDKKDLIRNAYQRYASLSKTLAALNVVRVRLATLSNIKTPNPKGLSFLSQFKKQSSFEFICSVIDKLEKEAKKTATDLEKELTGCLLAMDEDDFRKIRDEYISEPSEIKGCCSAIKQFEVQKIIEKENMNYRHLFHTENEEFTELISKEDPEILESFIKFLEENIGITNAEEKNMIISKLRSEQEVQRRTRPKSNNKEEEQKEQPQVTEEIKQSTEQDTNKGSIIEPPVVEEERIIIDPEEKQKYLTFLKLREKFDEVQEHRKDYSSEEDYYNYVLAQFSHDELVYASTIEEIVENFKNLRKELYITTLLQNIIEEVEADYENINDKYIEEENGLLNIENRLAFRFISYLRNNSIPDELKMEIKYSLAKYNKVEAISKNLKEELALGRLSPEAYREKKLRLKKKEYINTIFYDALGLESIEKNIKM